MQSQTGYGRGTFSNSLGSATAEVKAVNGRFLDITTKGRVGQIEAEIKKEVEKAASRGTVEVRVFLEQSGGSKSINIDVAKEELARAKMLAKIAGAKQNVGSRELLLVPGVVTETELSKEELLSLVMPALSGALAEFVMFKNKEGKALEADLLGSLAEIEALVESVKVRAPKMVKENQDKMRGRITELLGDVQLDEARLANEVAVFVDRVDINEEIKRLGSHIAQFKELAKSKVCGKQLEFLSQEMTREINTMGSKSNDIEITKCVLQMKNANEKIKEQIRNVE